MAMNILVLNNIQKKFTNHKRMEIPVHQFQLKVNHLEIKKGDFYGLLGPSGCGKTTLLKMIAGLNDLDEGMIFIHGRDITRIPTEKRNIGMVFQQPLLFPHMTVKENIAFGLKMKKLPQKIQIEKVEHILEVVGLKGFGERYPGQLSGGQQQRVAIARAVVCEPEILLMDEPLSALDPNLRQEMREFITQLHQKFEMTILFVTHDLEEAFCLFNKMAVIIDGKIVQEGKPLEILENPRTLQIAKFLTVNNIFKGKLKNGFLDFTGES